MKFDKNYLIKLIMLFVIINIVLFFIIFPDAILLLTKGHMNKEYYVIDHTEEVARIAKGSSFVPDKYSVFIDENGNTFKKKTTLNDYTGRNVLMYTSKNQKIRANLEMRDLGVAAYGLILLIEITLIYLIIFTIRKIKGV